jgi:hypothetical protein
VTGTSEFVSYRIIYVAGKELEEQTFRLPFVPGTHTKAKSRKICTPAQFIYKDCTAKASETFYTGTIDQKVVAFTVTPTLQNGMVAKRVPEQTRVNSTREAKRGAPKTLEAAGQKGSKAQHKKHSIRNTSNHFDKARRQYVRASLPRRLLPHGAG